MTKRKWDISGGNSEMSWLYFVSVLYSHQKCALNKPYFISSDSLFHLEWCESWFVLSLYTASFFWGTSILMLCLVFWLGKSNVEFHLLSKKTMGYLLFFLFWFSFTLLPSIWTPGNKVRQRSLQICSSWWHLCFWTLQAPLAGFVWSLPLKLDDTHQSSKLHSFQEQTVQ